MKDKLGDTVGAKAGHKEVGNKAGDTQRGKVENKAGRKLRDKVRNKARDKVGDVDDTKAGGRPGDKLGDKLETTRNTVGNKPRDIVKEKV